MEASSGSTSSGTSDLPLDRLRTHLEEHGIAVVDLTADRIGGGRSNLTYRLTAETAAGTHVWVLRRPPLGHVLATAHDMGREFRVISALAGTQVPVPRARLMCDDVDVIGAPFFLMEHVAGEVVRTDEALVALGQDACTAGATLVGVIAALHDVDPKAVGLADFGRPEGFMERQVRRWTAQLASSRSRDLEGIDHLSASLAESVPTRADVALIHGDFRLDNCLISGGRVAAVLDWEMATIGDPLADLALFAVYTGGFSGAGFDVIHSPAGVGAFPTTRELVDQYVAATGRSLESFGWYLGFAWFKLAAILEGIRYRRFIGKSAGDESRGVDLVVPHVIERGLTALASDEWSV